MYRAAVVDLCIPRRASWDGSAPWKLGEYGRYGFQLQMKDISVKQIQEFPKTRCLHPTCGYQMVDSHLKWPQCFRQIEPVTEANIATEVARRKASTIYGLCSHVYIYTQFILYVYIYNICIFTIYIDICIYYLQYIYIYYIQYMYIHIFICIFI